VRSFLSLCVPNKTVTSLCWRLRRFSEITNFKPPWQSVPSLFLHSHCLRLQNKQKKINFHRKIYVFNVHSSPFIATTVPYTLDFQANTTNHRKWPAHTWSSQLQFGTQRQKRWGNERKMEGQTQSPQLQVVFCLLKIWHRIFWYITNPPSLIMGAAN